MPLTTNTAPRKRKDSAGRPFGRDELRQERQEEQRHFRIEHVGQQPVIRRRDRAPSRSHLRRAAARAGSIRTPR